MKIIIGFICIAMFLPAIASGEKEESYIVTDAPIAVGGGIIRYYEHIKDDRLSIRYSFKGADGENIYIEIITISKKKDSIKREFLKLPLDVSSSRKSCTLQIGSKTLLLKLTRKGRLIASEIKKD